MAEGVGFEPTVGFPTLDFESSALNRTQPPFLSFGIVGVNLRRAIITRTSEFAKAKHHATSNRHENYAYRRGIETRSAASCQCCGTDYRSIEALAKTRGAGSVTESNSAKAELSEKMLQF